MSNNNITIINKYKVFNMFDQYLVENIKMFYIPSDEEVLYVTKDDQVFKYRSKFLIRTKYDELCTKHVIKFASSFEHYMALTHMGSVYSWGSNKFGELGDGTNVLYYDNPKLISALSDEHIIDICCGHMHSLALTGNGFVYAFGFNSFGAIGNFRTEHQLIPFKVNLFRPSKVKSISCGLHHSVALTEDGRVSVWGSNSWGQLGIGNRNMQQIPTQLINVPRIKQIICDSYGTILLTIEGEIFFCGLDNQSLRHKLPIKVNINIKFIEMAASIHCGLCVALSVNNKCYTFGESKQHLNETPYTSMEETYAMLSKPQVTYKSYLLPFIKEYIKFNDKFEEIRLIDCGGFGSVFKVRDRKADEIYAVKKVYLRRTELNKITNEVNFLSQLKSSFTVKYIDSWIENNYYIGSFDSEQSSSSSNSLSSSNNIFNQHFPLLLHIQMELCPLSLRHAIVKLKQYIHDSNPNTIYSVCYYIISELFIEIVECVQYLHHQNPPVIHRDLKPANILLTNFVNFRFVKLADFGLSTFHEADNQMHTQDIGTKNYRAPEVSFDNTYSEKADIYSLGIIFTEMYNNIPSEIRHKKVDSLLNTKANKGGKNLMNKLILQQDLRPNCEKILSDKHHWSFTNEEIVRYKEISALLSKAQKAQSIADDFVEFFVQNKFASNQRHTHVKTRLMGKLFVNKALSE